MRGGETTALLGEVTVSQTLSDDEGPRKGGGASDDDDDGSRKGAWASSSGGGVGRERSSLASLVSCIYFCVPYDWISRGGIADRAKEDGKTRQGGINGPIATFFLLLNSMIGSGIFVQPYVFREVGIALALVLYVVVGTAIFTGVDLLMKSADRYGIFDYSKLASKVLGAGGQQLVDSVVVVGNLGSLVTYMLIVGTLSNDILQQYTGVSSVSLTTVVLTICCITPGCLIRSFGHLSVFAYFSMVAIFCTFLFVVIAGPVETRGDNLDEDLNYWDLHAGFTNIGNIVFALGFSNSAFHAYVSVKEVDRSAHNFSFISFSTVVVGMIVSIAFGVTGYLSFRDLTESNILLNFSGDFGAVFKVIVTVHLLLYLPGDYIVMRFSFFRLLGFHPDDISDNLHILGTFTTIFVIMAIVCAMQVYASDNSLAYSLDLTGGIANSLTFFFFPGLISLHSHSFQEHPRTFAKSVLLTLFGMALPILVTCSLIFK